ncbi:cutinase family protein [Candidatus Saccharibacteria bacterium]|nr:cutinase family protein [Candidatus Saccharibacteria bacterium]MBR3378064.1 cutinase family protein [Candidatus Saccharibacteria bacterium]
MKKIFAIFGVIFSVIFGVQNCFALPSDSTSNYINCYDVMFVFARGSGGKLGLSSEFFDISNAAYNITTTQNIRARAVDLDYPAVSIATPQRILRTYVSAGKSYSFGNSVKVGVSNLRLYYQAAHKKCPSMKFGFIGYSQGAMVIADAAKYFDRDAVLFIMMLGDPKTYLPEGEGLFPSACRGGAKSSWRTFAPNCRTSAGVFGARKPYEASHLTGKYSLWCNRRDYICGSSRNPFNNEGHVEYSGRGYIIAGIPMLMRKSGYSSSRPLLRSASVDNWLDEIEDDGGGAKLSMPNVSVWRDGNVAYLEWKPVVGAEYLLLRLNGYDLGYVDASLGKFEIRDIDSTEEFNLDFAWMDKDGNLSDIQESKTETVITSEQPAKTLTPQTVNTSEPKNERKQVRNEGKISTVKHIEKETQSSKSEQTIVSSSNNKRKNGLSLANEIDITKIVLAMAGASGLLLLLFVRRRH